MKTLFCHRYLPYILYPNLSFPTFWNGAIRSQAVALGRDPQVFLASAIDPPPLAAVETAMEQLVGIHAVAPGLGMAGHGWAMFKKRSEFQMARVNDVYILYNLYIYIYIYIDGI